MYIETSGGSPGDKAELSSYRYFASSPNCRMTLWYHMFGSGVGSLQVKLKKSDGSYSVLGNPLSGSQVRTTKTTLCFIPYLKKGKEKRKKIQC